MSSNAYKPARGKLSVKFSGSGTRRGGSGAKKRTLNRIYKKNTGRTTKGRNASLRKYK